MKKAHYSTLIDKYAKVYKPTNDDWAGNYPDNTVALMYIGELSDGTFRVLVKGNDDMGLERDYTDEGQALNTFRILSNYAYINKKDLLDLGFIHI